MASPPPPSHPDPETSPNPRISSDSAHGFLDTSSAAPIVNGHNHNPPNGDATAHDDAPGEDEGEINDVERLQQDLERTRAEKDVLADQYRSLLAKLTTMRNTLGNKLKEDAVSIHPTRALFHHSCLTPLLRKN